MVKFDLDFRELNDEDPVVKEFIWRKFREQQEEKSPSNPFPGGLPEVVETDDGSENRRKFKEAFDGVSMDMSHLSNTEDL